MSEIKFLLDENLPFGLLGFLISEGYKCNHIKKIGKSGITNGDVYRLATDLDSFLITRDSDFQDFSKFSLYPNLKGILILKMTNTSTTKIIAKVKEIIGKLEEVNINNSITIVEDNSITTVNRK